MCPNSFPHRPPVDGWELSFFSFVSPVFFFIFSGSVSHSSPATNCEKHIVITFCLQSLRLGTPWEHFCWEGEQGHRSKSLRTEQFSMSRDKSLLQLLCNILTTFLSRRSLSNQRMVLKNNYLTVLEEFAWPCNFTGMKGSKERKWTSVPKSMGILTNSTSLNSAAK